MVSYKYSYKTNDVFFHSYFMQTSYLEVAVTLAEWKRSAVTAILHIIIISDNIFVTTLAQKLKFALEGADFNSEEGSQLIWIK